MVNNNRSQSQPPPQKAPPQQPPPHQPPPQDDINSPNLPLFLHPRDHPGLVLISKKLTSQITMDHGKDTRALWERTNDMIISWILNTIKE
ncbi:hypothetical protein Tco_1249831 [Tanacetum coccineum]